MMGAHRVCAPTGHAVQLAFYTIQAATSLHRRSIVLQQTVAAMIALHRVFTLFRPRYDGAMLLSGAYNVY